jgi:hypothetical protein
MRPGAQSTQLLPVEELAAVPVENLPAPHVWQLVRLISKLPGGQGWHEPTPAYDMRPNAQSAQVLPVAEPADVPVENLPAAHVWQLRDSS